ncbi:hypothetical protein EWM64_g6293 [Hericium alpestre]|uniref:Uncharacterized protein n=1 Tax=Hericium alpestre TaxID=135208 RepID=A0A4Y9ZU72_9AGAM|nr:hypothetical protein EWM64_g6293 [Hericium alpestre]
MAFGGFSTSGLKPNLGTSWSTSNTPGAPTQPATQLATQAGTPQATSPPTQGGGLFGGQQQQNQPSTSLFGGLGQNQPQQQQQQQQPSTGLFGQPAQSAQTGTGTGLFAVKLEHEQSTTSEICLRCGFARDSAASDWGFVVIRAASAASTEYGIWTLRATSTAAPAEYGLIAVRTAAAKPAGYWHGFFIIRAATTATATAATSTATTPTTTVVSPSHNLYSRDVNTSFGFSTTQPSLALQPATPTGPPAFTKSTKYNDLPDNLKKVFEEIEGHIQGRVQISNELKQRKIGEEATKGQEHIRSVHKDLINAITILQSDVLAVRDLKIKVDQTVQDTIAATHIIDGFRNPQQHGAYLKNHASFPLEFFMRITDQIRRRLQWYKATIEQVERKLASTAQQAQYTPQAITTTLEAQHASFIALANKTAALDSEVQKLKSLYTQLWRQKTGSMRDPFYELDRGSGGEFGLESLYAK